MSALEVAILSIVQKLSKNPAPSPAPSFIPSPRVPAGLTLRNTYTASASGLTFPAEWVYVVAVGGGGSGNGYGGSNNGYGGGGGACIQGWVKAADLTAVTIGAGGAQTATGANTGNPGSATIAGPIRAPGGGGASTSVNNAGYMPEAGAGWGGCQSASTTNSTQPDPRQPGSTAYDLFTGAASMQSTSLKPPTATSGAGGGPGGDGYQGPAGGGGYNATGGNSVSPNGTTYTGAGPNGGNGGGGAGILANGSTGAVGSTGGAGGSGGGGGGAAGTTSGAGGAGGNGAVLVYY